MVDKPQETNQLSELHTDMRAVFLTPSGNRVLNYLVKIAHVNEATYDGPDAWKNADGTEFIAGANDIVEWDGTKWHIVFDASEDDSTVVFTTNLNTGKQYKYVNNEWILSYDGEYPVGTWYLNF